MSPSNFSYNTNGNASTGIGTGGSNNTFTLQNGSFFTLGNASAYPAGFGSTGYGSPYNWGNGGAYFGIGSSTYTGQTLNVLSGGTFATQRRFSVGDSTTNHVNVDGVGSKFIQPNGNSPNGVGGTWTITNGGTAFFPNYGGSTKPTFNATVSGTDPTTGYGATWHSIGGISLPASTNTLTISSGGFLEFESSATPSLSLNNANTVVINGGGLSYGQTQTPAAYSGDLLGSNAGNTLNTIGGFTWSGNNRFRINGGTAGISDTGTTAYTFANNLGAQNYYALDLVGTASITGRVITFDGDHGGAMKLSGATATLSGGVALSGATPVTFTAIGTASTLTGAISGTGGLVKAGTGSLTIADSMIAYTGGYDIGTGAGNGMITGGGLRIDQAGSFTLGATGSSLPEGLSASFAVQSQFAAHMGTQSGVPTGKEGFDADANSDGVGNGLAGLLGGAAMSESIGLLPQATFDSGYLRLFNFKALKADKRLGTTLSVQYSSDLGISDSWHAAVVPSAHGVSSVNDVRFTITDNGGDFDTIVAEIPQLKALDGGKLFSRLEAIGQ